MKSQKHRLSIGSFKYFIMPNKRRLRSEEELVNSIKRLIFLLNFIGFLCLNQVFCTVKFSNLENVKRNSPVDVETGKFEGKFLKNY